MARDLKVLEDVGSQHWAFYSFVHDKWQVSPRMTVDLGLRWEYYDPIIGLAGKGSLSNYDPATNSLLVSGYGNVADDFGVKKDFNNFSPRMGATFRLDDKTVVRGGFGASTTPFPDNRYAFNYPVKQNNSYQTPNSYSPTPYNMAAGFPAPSFLSIPDSGIIDANAVLGQSLFYVPNDLQQGSLYSWNVAFQREIDWGLTGEVAYVGNMSNDVLNRFPMNAGLVIGAGIAGQPLYAKYGKTAGVENLAWKGKTRYNGLQMKLDRRFRNGWLVTNSYTYSRARDYSNDNGGPSTPAEPERSWGFGNFDRTHVYVSSFVWSLPWYKDTDSGALHWILGNWQVSGIFTLSVGPGPRRHVGQRGVAQHAGQHAAAGSERRRHDREHDGAQQYVPPVVRHVGVLGAGGQHLRQHDPQHGRRARPAVHEPRLQPREAVQPRRQPDGRVPHGRLEPAEHDSHEQPEHVVRQRELRPDHQRLQRAPDALQRPVHVLGRT